MKFKLEFDMNNAIFEENGNKFEVVRLLQSCAHVIHNWGELQVGDERRIKDSNGNTIGYWSITNEN